MPTRAKKTTPDDAEPAEIDSSAADAAVAEVDGPKLLTAEVAGVTFTFSRKRLGSVQYRRLMQKGRDAIALDWLLGESVVDKILMGLADGDGDTDADGWIEIFDAIGEAVGSGNS